VHDEFASSVFWLNPVDKAVARLSPQVEEHWRQLNHTARSSRLQNGRRAENDGGLGEEDQRLPGPQAELKKKQCC